MSTYMVSREHIDTMVTALLEWGIIQPTQADAVGNTLWAENYQAVCENWAKPERGFEGRSRRQVRRAIWRYSFTAIPGRVDPTVVKVAADSYKFQCGYDNHHEERPRWQGSQAHEWITALAGRAAAMMGPFAQEHGHLHANKVRYRGDNPELTAWFVNSREVFHAAERPRALSAESAETQRGMPNDAA